jgi:hypothetical protein
MSSIGDSQGTQSYRDSSDEGMKESQEQLETPEEVFFVFVLNNLYNKL